VSGRRLFLFATFLGCERQNAKHRHRRRNQRKHFNKHDPLSRYSNTSSATRQNSSSRSLTLAFLFDALAREIRSVKYVLPPFVEFDDR